MRQTKSRKTVVTSQGCLKKLTVICRFYLSINFD